MNPQEDMPSPARLHKLIDELLGTPGVLENENATKLILSMRDELRLVVTAFDKKAEEIREKEYWFDSWRQELLQLKEEKAQREAEARLKQQSGKSTASS